MVRNWRLATPSGRNATRALRVLLFLLVAIGAWAEECSITNTVSLSTHLSSNTTGHPQLNVRLEQPADAESLQLDIELGTSACGPDGALRKTLILNINGAPPPPRGPPQGYARLPEAPELGFLRQGAQATEWSAARDSCAAEGAALAMPASEAEALAFVHAFAFNVSGATRRDLAWLGASDIQQEGTFVTLAGVPLRVHGYNKWTPNQPAGGTTENCLAFWAQTALLEDVPCGWKLPYICKISV